MAADINKALGAESELIERGRGIFDVEVDGVIVYSKYTTGTFPDSDALVDLLLSIRSEAP